MLKIQENVFLNKITTLRVGGKARYFTIIKNEDDLHEVLSFIKSRKLNYFILGGGSNLLFSDAGYGGLIIKNEIKGIKFIDKDNGHVSLEVGAGENLDEIIALASVRKLSGLENLSGIPGTVGGAVTQNAGAYGQEIKDCLISVSGINAQNGKPFCFTNKDCVFKYRDSLFKKNKKFIITNASFVLSKKLILNIEYTGLKSKLGKLQNDNYLPEQVRKAVLEIRKEKLPDWHKIGTAGSFFMNPVISNKKYEELKVRYPNIPGFLDGQDLIKIPLAWILDNICGLNGYKEGKVGLYEKQPLVLINLGGASTRDIEFFSKKIKNFVKEKTGIDIETEVEFVC
jgi:UDP-N-acetylmuramate dehydrogenase